MKRCLVSILLLAMAAVACRREGGETTIALVPMAMDSEFWLALAEGAKAAAAMRPEVRLSIVAPDREINIDQQVSILEDQIRRGVRALVVAPSGPAQIMPVLDQAAARGIPVVLVDTDAPWPRKVSYIGTDNRKGGGLAARFLAERLHGRGRIAMIHGLPGNLSQDERASGFVETLGGFEGMELVARQPAHSERALALNVMENILTAHPDLEAVFATNDQMALGALEALDARGLRGRVLVVGFDATQEAVRATLEGRLTATIAQNPEAMGRKAVEAALAALEGRKVPARVDTGTDLVTAENAARSLR